MELLIRRPPHEPEHSRPTFRPPWHRRLQRHLPGSPEGVAMEGIMLEILISLCQTGAKICGFALGLIGIGIGTVVGVAIFVAKEEVRKNDR